ncbi:unnamed protein product [Echinostoma caproni]|uniref:ANF_receptor domain-containing protein n=1 Tax=Echinostoma caproni TaxID=27848 RepID=A0A183AVA1_9TREM|nr:unnamed protein product [Echinostoma caproni]
MIVPIDEVNFNEPISFLQRAAEDLTYSYLLDQASQVTDPAEQMALVAAFSVSCYASTAIRTGKPFNPLLGETYEMDRSNDSYCWRLIAEQMRTAMSSFQVSGIDISLDGNLSDLEYADKILLFSEDPG